MQRVWQDSTRSNALFISTAVNLNNKQLLPIFNWFTKNLIIITPKKFTFSSTIERFKNATHLEKSLLINFLRAADLGITDIEIEPKRQRLGEELVNYGSELTYSSKLNINEFKITFVHANKSDEDNVRINLFNT